ncbi:MAG: DUF262 domain-containing HNH endonuclease family protein [Microscillaceae bacterium]|nr:DUF262 domain-containing HNH endonuclease family protein [Microscillaceae bacterium]MDW8460785.1 DUF262 domain-containing protein [Cytophagales bacterium]
MQARETKLQDMLEGTKQYVVPLFQRTYSWEKKEWNILWEDLTELYEMPEPRIHFFGSIVSMPTTSVPEGVAKYLLIDGQQRLTTISIILTLLRNKAKEEKQTRLAEEINNTLLVNQYKDGIDRYKLLPTQIDRATYQNLIDNTRTNTSNLLLEAYKYFERKLRQANLELERLKKIITNYFSVVSIVLDANENPYVVFESLNAKGQPLTQADLIRNYFFMQIHVNEQERVYREYWLPMQEALQEDLTEFIRHYLIMEKGGIIGKNDIYYVLKDKVSTQNAIEYLSKLTKYASYYQKLKHPTSEQEPKLRKMLERLNRIEVTTTYPLLLNFYNDYANSRISKNDFLTILKLLENYLVRRFVCNYPTNRLNSIFSSIYPQIHPNYPIEGLKNILQAKGYPKDNEFYQRFQETKFYSKGDGSIKTKLILEAIEESYNHREVASFENLTIEHIMPQTLSKWWEEHLGENWQEVHELYLHTIGNLTLTAYNSELSNKDFNTKKQRFMESHLELNKYFAQESQWTKAEIEKRSEILAKKALEIWNYFGSDNSNEEPKDVTKTKPRSLQILGQNFKVNSWREVLEITLNEIADLEPEKFEVIASTFKKYVGKNENKFRTAKKLRNGYFVEVNLSAQSINKLCYQAIQTIGLSYEDWKVITE